MIPRKKIQFVIRTLCILYTFGNEGCVLADHIETKSADQLELTNNRISSNDNGYPDSMVITNTYPQSKTTADLSNSIGGNTSPILDAPLATSAYSQFETVYQSPKIDSNTIPSSTEAINAYSQSETAVEYSTVNVTETGEETSSPSNTNIWSDGTTELFFCKDVPSSVQNLTVSAATNTTILVTWESVTFDDGCIIEYNITWYSDINYSYFQTVNFTQLDFTISDLTPCTNYTINVIAVGLNNVSNGQTILSSTTESHISQVRDLTVLIIDNGLNVTWNPPEDESCLQSYLVDIMTEDDMILDVGTALPPDTFYTFDNLSACTNYTVQVTPISINTNYGTVTTIYDSETSASVPGPVRNLNAPTEQITGNSVFLTWLAPILNPSCVKYYNVTTCNNNNCFDAETTDLFYNVTSLSSCLAYSFTVTAVGDISSSEIESETADTSDVVPGPVSNLIAPIENRTGYSVYLTWSAPTFNLNCVQYYNVTTCHDNDCVVANTTALFYDATDLDPCFNYSFTVYAVGNAGSSDGETITASTSNIKPGEPASIVAIPGQFSLFVYWDPPEIGGTCVTSYRVTVWATGATWTTTDTNMTVLNLSACVNYTVQITPLTMSGDGQFDTVANITEESLTGPPIPEVAEPNVTKSTISIAWFIDRTMNKCELKTVLTICNFTWTDGRGFEELDQQSEYDILDYDSSNNVTINVEVTNLSPFSSYECTGAIQNIVGYSESSIAVIATTAEDVPSAPKVRVTDLKSSTFTVQWDEPEYLAGNLIQHEIFLSWKRLFLMPSSCNPEDLITNVTISDIEGSALEHIYPNALVYSQYTASIRAKTNAGWGDYSNDTIFNTAADVPGAVTSIKYLNKSSSADPNVLDTFLSWKLPCSLNGELQYFYIDFEGIRDGFDNHTYNEKYDDVGSIGADKVFTKNFGELKAEYNYTFKISTKVVGVLSHGPSNSISNVIYPAGIPPLPDESYMNHIQLDKYKMKRSSSTVAILLPLFNNTNGDIKYYAVMISETSENELANSRFDIRSGSWPNTTSWKEAMSHTPIIIYQSTPVRWYPDKTKDIFDAGHLKAVKFLLGTDDSCSKLSTATYCNGPLRADTQYQVKMRAFTNGGFRDSQVLIIKTKAEFNLGMVIGVVFGILFFGIITTMMLLIRKGVLQTALSNILHPSVQNSPGPDPFTRKKFELHCQELIDNPGKLSNEFQLLQTLSVDLEMSANAAELQANKKKNRYINILPYDISRVKLDVVNNDPNSDYINASLIPGYSGGKEYIACQGPKEETTYDFWRMIYQYNVKVIVMVTQLVEKGKDKCYQYYPNTRESFEHEDIMIRCSTQLDFVFYTQRNITLEKQGGDKRTVTHLHFKEWSDHGVPDDVHSMINFCQIVRKLIHESKSLAVVHCSAGVGRTGTLIAVDILLQQIKDNKKLDVFGTVYKMRQHRMNMVQTESQYAYIYNCTKQALNNPPKHYKTSSPEPVYENLAMKRRDKTHSNTNFGNSAESLKKMSPSVSSNSMEPICEIIVPQRPIYTSQLSTLSLRYSKSSSAINTQVPSNLEIGRYGSYEYPIFEPAPDSPLSKVNVDMNSFLEFARPISIETRISRPESINFDETIDQSMCGVRPSH